MKNAIFWNVSETLAGEARREEILSGLMIKAIPSSETSVLKRGARPHITEDGILHSHRRENLCSYVLKISKLTMKYET
jgi:hypothetical protein